MTPPRLLAIAAAFAFTGTTFAQDAQPAVEPVEQGVADVAAGNNAFAFDLYRSLRTQDAEANRFFSPFSITSAFGMVQVGARGETADQIRDTLHYPADGDALHTALGKFIDGTRGAVLADDGAASDGFVQRLRGDSADDDADDDDADSDSATPVDAPDADDDAPRGYEIRVANAMWLEQDFPFAEETFLKPIERAYGPSVKRVDFRNDAPAQAAKVNQWCADNTNDKITKILEEDDLTSDTRFVIANAIWFKGTWDEPFIEIKPEAEVEPGQHWLQASMRQQPFKVFSGADVKNDLMLIQHKPFDHAWIDPTSGEAMETTFLTQAQPKIELVDLPYDGGDVSMLVILPPEGADAFAEVEAQLDAETLNGWLRQMRTRTVETLRFPKFKLEPETLELGETLPALGMEEPFKPVSGPAGADFSAMLDPAQRSLYIDFVKHKAFIEVNEKSTEAAAVTVIGGFESTSVPVNLDPHFRADRPFVFLIRDKRTATEDNPLGTILFLGRLLDPSKN